MRQPLQFLLDVGLKVPAASARAAINEQVGPPVWRNSTRALCGLTWFLPWRTLHISMKMSAILVSERDLVAAPNETDVRMSASSSGGRPQVLTPH